MFRRTIFILVVVLVLLLHLHVSHGVCCLFSEKHYEGFNPLSVEENIQVVEDCIADFCACCPCYGHSEENPDNAVLSKMGE